ncbi:ABC transporter ATP-binding protein [Agrobacterium salinitolerans]|uniref:ABC transporter ATP-binding protein n=1 Tax=Agrobacterium salinitolerans TaxID=1183413 RepID=UPI0015724396|nr:ABC transporter ATP-binding protein [Agrobacterium salinitolerans]NTA40176.1 ABC transporter ATP-binding protein [Agrobacterium salinitolerans]
MNALITATNLRKSFPIFGGRLIKRQIGALHAVEDVSFTIARGETLAVVGESGCGKSTTGRLVMRLIEPTAGQVDFDGVDLMSLRGEKLKQERRRLQLIFQDPSSAFNPRMTVANLVAEPMNIAGRSASEQRERVRELLPLVGLASEHADRFPHQFSGGQRQRIGIARALALRPDFVVCDEPVSALDVSVQAQVVNLLKDLQQQFGLTYMFISHDLRVVRHIADRVAVMYLGKIVEYGEKRKVYSNPAHPYTRLLMSAVPLPEPGRKRHVATVGEIENQGIANSGCRFASRCPHVMPICRDVVPTLVETDIDHSAACHLVNKSLGAAA